MSVTKPTLKKSVTIDPDVLDALVPERRANLSATVNDGLQILAALDAQGAIVDDPGTWSAVYPPLLHAEWNGWTYTDTIFPFFLFLVGVSMAISFARRRAEGQTTATLLRHTVVRALILTHGDTDHIGFAGKLSRETGIAAGRYRVSRR